MSNEATLVREIETIDLLDRERFVDQMLTISQNLANNKQNACYALNGEWGIGKTFVFDMFQKKLNDQPYANNGYKPFLVFRYNCWENDYYDEPLIAIVATMLEEIDSLQELSIDDKNMLVNVLMSVGTTLLNCGISWAEKEMGIENGGIREAYESITDGVNSGKAATRKAKEFDLNAGFNKALKKLRGQIEKLSEKQTVVFLVDELDRCLPEYTIKVLEHLHHLFDAMPNVQMVLAIDRKQLEHTIKQIFGPNTDSKKYLQKFIQFELTLDEGAFQDNFDRRFARYSMCFSENDLVFDDEIFAFKSALLQGLDMRRRITLVNRCEVIHRLLSGKNPNESYNQDYLCIELFLTLLHDSEFSTSAAEKYFRDYDNLMSGRTAREKTDTDQTDTYDFLPSTAFGAHDHPIALPEGLQWIEKEYKQYGYDFLTERISVDSLIGCLVAIYGRIIGFSSNIFGKYAYTYSKGLIDFGLKYWNYLTVIS